MMNENLKGKRLLVLGGSRISCEIIRHAREMGIVTGVTDWYALERSPAKQLADEAYFESTSDIDTMVNLIREKKFDGVITGFTDSVLPYYAVMCERAGLPAYGTKEQFDIFINKQKYKTLLRKFNIPTVPEYRIDPNDIENSARDVHYPVLVKPSDSSGARGITICNNIDDLKIAVGTASSASQTGSILVEEYLDGPECTIFWVFKDGQYYMVLMGNRHVKHNQIGVIPLPVGYTYPAACQERFLNELAPNMRKMFRSVGIRNGMMFMQCKVMDGTCVVYDIGYRLTGSLEYINLHDACGFDPLDMLINFALTGDMGEPELGAKVEPGLNGRYAFNVSLLSKPGTIAKIEGLERVRAIPNVIDVVVAHTEGDTITESMRGLLAQISVRILGTADSIEQMKRVMFDIGNNVHIISTSGEEMLLPGMTDADFLGVLPE